MTPSSENTNKPRNPLLSFGESVRVKSRAKTGLAVRRYRATWRDPAGSSGVYKTGQRPTPDDPVADRTAGLEPEPRSGNPGRVSRKGAGYAPMKGPPNAQVGHFSDVGKMVGDFVAVRRKGLTDPDAVKLAALAGAE